MKFRIPSLLKSDKTKATLKQFLLSLLATTFSIALTFGTAAVIDHHKKQEAKREIVMMVMYDMYNSLEAIEEVDSTDTSVDAPATPAFGRHHKVF